MSHEIETMAFAGQTPWHGLCVEVEPTLTAEQMMVAAGLDWKVVKRPIMYKVGKDSRRTIKDRFALVRDTDEQYLSLCGPKYQPVQNKDVFDFFHKFVDAGHMEMHTAGSLMDGKFVWALAKVGDSFTLPGSDKVEGYLLLMSPHEAGRSMVIQHTSVRVVCWNTLNMALGSGLKGGEGAVRLTHVRAFDDSVREQAEIALGLSHEHLLSFKVAAEKLQEVKVDAELADEYFKTVFRLEVPVVSNDEEKKRDSRVLVKLRDALEHGPGAQLPGTVGTAWGALNAVTYVVDHQLGRDRAKVMRDNWLGYRGETKRRALEEALKLAA